MAPRKRRPATAPRPKPEPVVVDVCGCDCCARELGPGRAQADGYCPFCAERCYPVATLDAGYTRVTFDRASRERLHAEYDRAEETGVAQAPIDPAQQLFQQAAYTLGQIARPHVDRVVRQVLKKITG